MSGLAGSRVTRCLALLLGLLGLTLNGPGHAAPSGAATPAVAFYYGANPPVDELAAFDWAVVEPDHLPSPPADTPHTTWFAYISLGEVHPSRSYFARIPPAWRPARNDAWNSAVIDQTQDAWPEFVTTQIVAPLWNQGYRAFFLDTLDSYQLIARDEAARARQVAGLKRVIRAIKTRYPDAKLLFNRGFELLPELHPLVVGVAAESVIAGYDAGKKVYQPVSEADRSWLLARFEEVRSYRLPLIAIEYLPVEQREQARDVARRVQALGLIPWVATPELDHLGVGRIEVMPRQVLMVHDAPDKTDLAAHNIHVLAAMPVHYLGYHTVYQHVADPWPSYPLPGRVAGIVVWLEEGQASAQAALWRQLAQAREQGIPVVLLGQPPFELGSRQAQQWGLRYQEGMARGAPPGRVVRQHAAVGGEFQVVVERDAFLGVTSSDAGAQPWLELQQRGVTEHPVAVTPWGGYAFDPYLVRTLPNQSSRWLVDPIAFLEAALRLPAMPVPDVTTATGRRVLMAHVDGDGWANKAEMPGYPFSSRVLLDRVLKTYRIPTAVSVIEGEIGPAGLYPKDSPALESVARDIFRLPHVEIASHTYSHPFKWRALEARERQASASKGARAPDKAVEDEKMEGYNLNIPGYRFNVAREVTGTVDYINQRLAPTGKRTRIVLWTGDTNPGPDALGLAYGAGLLNMNSGDTIITRSQPTLTLVAPYSLKKGAHYQVYAPNQNENVYTNDWTGPFYGYRRVVETFELTDKPRRLKPINIYYHTYAASKRASLQALTEVYDWALRQAVHPVYPSEYIESVLDFHRAVVARDGEGWRLRSGPRLRNWRFPAALGQPGMEDAVQVAGWAPGVAGHYLHTSSGHAWLRFAAADQVPYLLDANAQVVSWSGSAKDRQFSLRGHVPLWFRLARTQGCQVWQGATPLAPSTRQGDVLEFRMTQHAAQSLKLSCR